MAKSTEASSSPKKIEYVATVDCMHENRWYGKGQTIIADEGFDHACFIKKSEYVQKDEDGRLYDPTRDKMEKLRLGEVMKGVYKN